MSILGKYNFRSLKHVNMYILNLSKKCWFKFKSFTIFITLECFIYIYCTLFITGFDVLCKYWARLCVNSFKHLSTPSSHFDFNFFVKMLLLLSLTIYKQYSCTFVQCTSIYKEYMYNFDVHVHCTLYNVHVQLYVLYLYNCEIYCTVR